VIVDSCGGDAVFTEDFIHGRPGGRNLQGLEPAPLHLRIKRAAAAAVAAVGQTHGILDLQRVRGDRPAGGGGCPGAAAEDLFELPACPAQFHGRDRFGEPGEQVVPFHMIPAVNSHLVTLFFRCPEDVGKRGGDERRRKERAVEHGLQAVCCRRLRPEHFFQETFPGEDTPDGFARVVRPHGEVKGGLDAEARHYLQQPRNPVAGPGIGVNVNF